MHTPYISVTDRQTDGRTENLRWQWAHLRGNCMRFRRGLF